MQSYKVQQGTFVVNPGESIAAAIAEAEPGATVFVKPGVYTNAADVDGGRARHLRPRVESGPRRHWRGSVRLQGPDAAG